MCLLANRTWRVRYFLILISTTAKIMGIPLHRIFDTILSSWVVRDRTWEPSMANVHFHQESDSDLVLDSVWGGRGTCVQPTYHLSSPKAFPKLLQLFLSWCLSDYMGYHPRHTFSYECWHFWCFLIGPRHLWRPVKSNQQMFWPQGVEGGGSRQKEDIHTPNSSLVSREWEEWIV